MIYVTERERLALAVLGVAALVGMGVGMWQQRHAPIQVAAGLPVEAWDSALQEARRVDLNAATAEELERLPEIGPSLAQRILQYRQAHGPFRRADELVQVPGIGPKTYEALREHVTAR